MKAYLTLAAALVVSTRVAAVTIDFESFGVGTVVSGPGVFSDLAFSRGGETISVTSAVPGPDLSGSRTASGDPFTGNPFRADFSIGGVTSVSVAMGDFNADSENLFLNAFDSLNNLLASDAAFLAASVFGGPTLTVASATAIAYVTFGSSGSFPNSVFFDNFTYTATATDVPPPTNNVPDASASAMLLGLSLCGLTAFRRLLPGKK